MDKRTSKENYYLDIADAVLQRSTCLRRMYGAIIVRNDEIISTGYNGAPRGRINCTDAGRCARVEMKIPSGERYELCRSVHAEANAIISASRRDMIGSTLYLVGRDAQTHELLTNATSCSMCRRQVINAGIERVIIRTGDDTFNIVDVERRLRFLDRITKKRPPRRSFFIANTARPQAILTDWTQCIPIFPYNRHHPEPHDHRTIFAKYPGVWLLRQLL